MDRLVVPARAAVSSVNERDRGDKLTARSRGTRPTAASDEGASQAPRLFPLFGSCARVCSEFNQSTCWNEASSRERVPRHSRAMCENVNQRRVIRCVLVDELEIGQQPRDLVGPAKVSFVDKFADGRGGEQLRVRGNAIECLLLEEDVSAARKPWDGPQR